VKRAKRISLVVFFLILTLWNSSVEANPSLDDPCEKLYAAYLLKAKKALEEDRTEEALRFLLEAEAVAKTCSDSSDRPLPQRQIRESSHAFTPHHNCLS
jgi:hypothetical protein